MTGSKRRWLARVALLAAAACGGAQAAGAQALDCGRLQEQIAQSGGGGGRYAQAARRQANELARTQAYARQLGCEGLASFFGGNPQCGGLNGRSAQMQANLAQLQGAAGGGGARADLVARYNAYCRGAPQQPRGFFEQLFGGGQPAPPAPPPPAEEAREEGEDDGLHARGGSQAVCVRSCDGGFFPMSISSRHRAEDLTQMCQALCPGTDTAVFTRSPDSDIKSALGLDGRPYMDSPNALKFQKSFTPACSCRQPGKGWAETLANAEEVLDSTRKGDIVVTPEKSAELARPKGEVKLQARSEAKPAVAAAPAVTPAAEGARQGIRQVGPQP